MSALAASSHARNLVSDRFFLDTNIFVYCFDRSNSQKQQTADSLVRRALTDQSGLISTQVIQEFLNCGNQEILSAYVEPGSSRLSWFCAGATLQGFPNL